MPQAHRCRRGAEIALMLFMPPLVCVRMSRQHEQCRLCCASGQSAESFRQCILLALMPPAYCKLVPLLLQSV